MIDILVILIFPLAMSFAAAMDLFTMTIPNRVSLFLLIAFFILAPLSGFTLSDISLHLAAGIAMLAVGIFLFSVGWIGGGDAKIFAAAALWFGFDHLLIFVATTCIFGGLLTILILLWRAMPIQSFLSNENWALHLHNYKTGIPYGIAIGAAALFVYPETQWIQYLIK